MHISNSKYRDRKVNVTDFIIVNCRPVLTYLTKIYETTVTTSIPGEKHCFQCGLTCTAFVMKQNSTLFCGWLGIILLLRHRAKMSEIKSPL
jgi:hypothetical protein